MDEQTKRLVEEAEERAIHAPTRDASTWELFVADIVVENERIGDMTADVTECVGIENQEAAFLEHAPSDVLALCAKVRELDAKNEGLRIRLREALETTLSEIDLRMAAETSLARERDIRERVEVELKHEIIAREKDAAKYENSQRPCVRYGCDSRDFNPCTRCGRVVEPWC